MIQKAVSTFAFGSSHQYAPSTPAIAPDAPTSGTPPDLEGQPDASERQSRRPRRRSTRAERILPDASSTLLPKIQRKSMFPPMWIQLPWMNIAVNTANTNRCGGRRRGLHAGHRAARTGSSRSGRRRDSRRVHHSQSQTIVLAAISATVTTGNVRVGTLSLSGSAGAEARHDERRRVPRSRASEEVWREVPGAKRVPGAEREAHEREPGPGRSNEARAAPRRGRGRSRST